MSAVVPLMPFVPLCGRQKTQRAIWCFVQLVSPSYTLPHNGTVLTVLYVCGLTHRESYFDMVMTVIVSVIVSLIAVVALGSVFGSF